MRNEGMKEEAEKGLGFQIKYWQILEDSEKLTERFHWFGFQFNGHGGHSFALFSSFLIQTWFKLWITLK